MNPEKIRDSFTLVQLGLGAVFIGLAWIFFRPKRPESGFRDQKSDDQLIGPNNLQEALKKRKRLEPEQNLARSKIKASEPLRLTGLSVSGKPHEILGVRPTATEAEIQAAFKALIKRYHPDLVGRPGSREWTDAQKLAEALNRAKAEMLAQLKTRK